MSELIDRNVLKAKMYQEAFESDTDMQKWDSGCWIRYKLFEKVVDSTPTVPYGPRWHRVEDELPDLLQFVVVCNDEGKCVVVQYVGYQTDSLTSWRIAYTMYDTDIYDEKECGPVRYWMPIEPPKEDA